MTKRPPRRADTAAASARSRGTLVGGAQAATGQAATAQAATAQAATGPFTTAPAAGAAPFGPIVALQLVLFVAMAVYYLWHSPGTYHDDDLDHYFMARGAFAHPDFFLNTWGRPALTLLYALPAQLGLTAARLFTIGLVALTAWLTALTARRLGFRLAHAAAGLTLWQPLFFLLSFSVLAEPLAALAVAALLWCVADDRPVAAGFVLGLLPLARLELIVFWAPWFVWLVWRQRRAAGPFSPAALARPLAALALPLVVWAVVGAVAHGDPLWLSHAISGTARPLTTTGPLIYMRNYIAACGAVVLFGLCLGFAVLLTPGRDDAPRPVFAATLWLLGFTVLTLLTWDRLKLGGSIGFLRHFVALAPAASLVALAGFEALGRELRGVRRVVFIALALLVPVGVGLGLTHRLEADYYIRAGRDWTRLLQLLPVATLILVGSLVGAESRARAVTARLAGIMPVLASLLFVLRVVQPLELNVERKTVKTAVDYLRQEAALDRPLAANHPWFYAFTGRDRWDRQATPYVTHVTLERLPRGGLVFWENHYGTRLYGDVTEDQLRTDPRFTLIFDVESGDRQFRVLVMQKK